jgi:TRAP-type C4-dicarboxylate transport system substrate-binding protein
MTARRSFLAYTAALAFTAARDLRPRSERDIALGRHPPDRLSDRRGRPLSRQAARGAHPGRVKINVFHSAQLGQEKDTIDQTRFGVIDINRINMAPFNNLIPATNIPSLPFIFRSVDHMRKAMDGQIGDNLLKEFEKHDLIGLASTIPARAPSTPSARSTRPPT